MRTDADRNYAASQPASGAGNEAKRKHFVRFLVSRFNHFYNYNFQVAVICKAEEGGDAVSIVD